MTFCDTIAETGVIFGHTHGTTESQNNGWTDRRDSSNAYLDLLKICELGLFINFIGTFLPVLDQVNALLALYSWLIHLYDIHEMR